MSYINLILFLSITFFVMVINAQDLEKHRWENRILIVQTTDPDDEKFVDQIKLFNDHKKGLIERKLILYKIIGNQFELLDFKTAKPLNSGTISESFRNKYLKNKSEFKILFLGLDGGIKLQQNNVLSIKVLFNTIDAMPMRRNEMRKN